MGAPDVFRRHEIKYLLTEEQYRSLRAAMEGRCRADVYGKSRIRNLYFDTPDWRIIRASMERPAYKEKLRLRSYVKAEKDTKVFLEIKKKYKSVVYKCRVSLTELEAERFIRGAGSLPPSQIAKEIGAFARLYPDLAPAVYLSYDREAFYENGTDLRITFDRNIRWRRENLSLRAESYGETVLPEGKVLMELKTCEAIPLWLVAFLSEERLYKTHFSKYGAVYETMLLRGETRCADISIMRADVVPPEKRRIYQC